MEVTLKNKETIEKYSEEYNIIKKYLEEVYTSRSGDYDEKDYNITEDDFQTLLKKKEFNKVRKYFELFLCKIEIVNLETDYDVFEYSVTFNLSNNKFYLYGHEYQRSICGRDSFYDNKVYCDKEIFEYIEGFDKNYYEDLFVYEISNISKPVLALVQNKKLIELIETFGEED